MRRTPIAPPTPSAPGRRPRDSTRAAGTVATAVRALGFALLAATAATGDDTGTSLNGFTGAMEHVLSMTPPGDPEPLLLQMTLPEGMLAEPHDGSRPGATAGLPWVARWAYVPDVRMGGYTNFGTLCLYPVPEDLKSPDEVVRDAVKRLVDALVAGGWQIVIPLREMGFRTRSRVRDVTVRTYAGEFAAKDGYTISGATGKNERANYVVLAIVTPRTVGLLLCENDESASKFTGAFRVVPATRASPEPVRARVNFSNVREDGQSLRLGWTLPPGFAAYHPRAAATDSVNLSSETERPSFEWRRPATTEVGAGSLTVDEVPAPMGLEAEWPAWLAERATYYPSPSTEKELRVGDVRVLRASGTGGGVSGRAAYELAAFAVGKRLYVIGLEEEGPAGDPGAAGARKRARAGLELVLARLGIVLTEPFRKPSTAR